MRQNLLAGFVDHTEGTRLSIHGIMVSQSGAVLDDHYWLKDTPHELRSLSKSFTSCAVGIAVDEGRLSRDDRVADFFADDMPAGPDEWIQQLTVRHLLTMAHGRDEPIMMSPQRAQIADPDWVRYFLEFPLDRAPGERFVYDTGATYMLSAIMQEICGRPLRDYLLGRLFEPLGIDNPRWDICPLGRSLGGAGLHLSIAEICRFGQLLLDNGRWEGTQLVPESYLKDATSRQIDTGSGGSGVDWTLGYGFQFWMCRHGAFRGDGADGQFCIVIPRLSAVIAITAQERKMQEILDAVWATVLPLL